MKSSLITELYHNYDFDDMSNLGFSSPPLKLISNHFSFFLDTPTNNVVRPTNVESYIMNE